MTRSTAIAVLLQRPLREVLAAVPARHLLRAGLGSCVGCAAAPFETLGEAVEILKLDAAKVAHALSVAFEPKGRR
jgi:hypothetical protein